MNIEITPKEFQTILVGLSARRMECTKSLRWRKKSSKEYWEDQLKESDQLYWALLTNYGV